MLKTRHFIPEQILANVVPADPEAIPDDARILPFCARDILIAGSESCPELFRASELPDMDGPVLIRVGSWDGLPCFAAELRALPEGMTRIPGRSLLQTGNQELWNVFSRARELTFWIRQHKFCGSCKAELTRSRNDLALICPVCGMKYYPQIAPAVIVAITRKNGQELLLAHNRNFQPGIYGLIAGFVEAGETAEQAVHREIMEETGICVKNVCYCSSQTWPFPNSLMLAFSAEYESGDVRADGVEIEDLNWFTKESLPQIPSGGSIAGQMIRSWLKNGTFHE